MIIFPEFLQNQKLCFCGVKSKTKNYNYSFQMIKTNSKINEASLSVIFHEGFLKINLYYPPFLFLESVIVHRCHRIFIVLRD
jgi:hypothetical protein